MDIKRFWKNFSVRSFLKVFLPIFVTVIVLFLNGQNEKTKQIFIIKTSDHIALDITENGIRESLKDFGIKDIKIKTESGQGSMPLLASIANRISNLKPYAVITIGTMATQNFIKHATAKKINLIYTSVSDPEILNLKRPDNIYGVSNMIDMEKQMSIIKKLQPNIQTIGFLYSMGESNSISALKEIKKAGSKMNIKIVDKSFMMPSDIMAAAKDLCKVSDAIFISNDNVALSNLQTIISVASKYKIPVYTSDIDQVENGAIASNGPSQYQIGRQTAKILAALINNDDMTKHKNIWYPKKIKTVINETKANELNIKISNDIKMTIISRKTQDGNLS